MNCNVELEFPTGVPHVIQVICIELMALPDQQRLAVADHPWRDPSSGAG
jgi:hypothetical protein